MKSVEALVMIFVSHKRARCVLTTECYRKQNKFLEKMGFLKRKRTTFTSISNSKDTHFKLNLLATLPVAYKPNTHLFNSNQVVSDV